MINGKTLARVAAAFAFATILGFGCATDDEEPTSSGGALWIIDQPNTVVYIYDYDGVRVDTIGALPFFLKPNCVAVDKSDGSTWVLDYYVNKLRKFDSDGDLLLETPALKGEEPLIRRGTSIAVDQDDGACWVADRSHARVLKIGSGGNVLATVTGFRSPRVVSLVPGAGDCWVVDELTDRAVKLPEAVSGEVTVDAVALASNSSFDSPWSVTADPDGGAWVLDKGTGSVVKVRPNGARGAELTGFNYPFDAAVSATTNNLYVVDYDAGLLASFDKSLQGSQSWDVAADFTVKGLLAATDVEIDETGGFVFVASDGRVGRYDTTGVLLSECVGIQTPVAVAADPGRSTP